VRDAAVGEAHARADRALGREQRHLRVVGDRAAVAAVGGQVARHAPRPEAGADLLERPELDRRAERVADGAGQQAAADPVAGRHPGQT
jgi:hypothetical protein